MYGRVWGGDCQTGYVGKGSVDVMVGTVGWGIVIIAQEALTYEIVIMTAQF